MAFYKYTPLHYLLYKISELTHISTYLKIRPGGNLEIRNYLEAIQFEDSPKEVEIVSDDGEMEGMS